MKIKCPGCNDQKINFLTVWLKGRFFSFKCPSCKEILKAKRHGGFIQQNYSFIIGIPLGIFLGIIIAGKIYRPLYLYILLFLVIITLIADFFLDKFAYRKGKLTVDKLNK